MPLIEIKKSRWGVYCYQDEDGVCDFENYMESIGEKDANIIYAQIERLADHGFSGLSTEIFHQSAVNNEVRINKGKENERMYHMYGLHRGRNKHRLYCILQDLDKFIVFTHGELKHSQKTDKKDIKKFKDIVQLLHEEGEL